MIGRGCWSRDSLFAIDQSLIAVDEYLIAVDFQGHWIVDVGSERASDGRLTGSSAAGIRRRTLGTLETVKTADVVVDGRVDVIVTRSGCSHGGVAVRCSGSTWRRPSIV